jgi:hypothetical protein
MNLPGEGDLFIPKSDTLDSLLPNIQKHMVALPNFQRPWVWDPDMVYDLLISVAYRYPAGSLLTMPIAQESFALRPFQGAGDKLKQRPSVMILDGQQRLTSLFQALFRRDGVEYRGRRYYFYLHVPTLMEDPDEIDVGDPYFDKALFYVTEDRRTGRRIRYDGLVPLYDLTDRDDEIAAGALPLGALFDSNGYLADWKKRYLVGLSNNEMTTYLELDDKWDRLVRPWLHRIKTYRFPVVELDHRMPLGAICHIFEKVNSTGVSLDVFDLCTAILWAQGFALNEEWAKTKNTLGPILSMQPLSGTYFLQGLALLHSLDRKRANPGQSIAVNCRRQDLMALRRSTVEEWWPVLVEGYKQAANFMDGEGILSGRILPYSTLVVPLSAILADLKYRRGDVFLGVAKSKIQRWYWCSVFSQRYSSQVETASARDYEQVINWVEGGEQPDAVRTFGFRSDALQEIRSIRNAVYKGVLALLARNGAKDFGGGGKLHVNLFYDSRQDHHHIFPVAALRRLGINDPRADTIVNKTLISAAVNRSIGGKLPAEYVTEWREKLGKDAFDENLLSHVVEPAHLAANNWGDYVLSRREGLRSLIEEACGGNFQPFSDEEELDVEEEGDEV